MPDQKQFRPPTQLSFRMGGSVCTITYSGDREYTKWVSEESEVFADREVPAWVEFTTTGGPDPDMRVRVELRDGAPQVVELAWIAHPDQDVIRQKHLKQTKVADIATDLIASTLIDSIPVGNMKFVPTKPAGAVVDQEQVRQSTLAAQRFVDRQRRPRQYRDIDNAFLREVAKVYRENPKAPTKAVAEKYSVERRMASNYVDRARKAGFLGPTSRGKKGT